MSELTYFESRMQSLGISAEQNTIDIWQYKADSQKNELVHHPIFKECEKGIEIFVYTLRRELIPYNKEGSRWKNRNYSITRLKDPIQKDKGDVIKYLIPKGQGTHPFFPPSLIDKFERKEPIETLFLVEGFFKAFKGYLHGIDIVGLSSITHMKDKDKGTLHPEIVELMRVCQVKRMVWLTDGDCLDITSKEITETVDLYKRPKGFFSSIETFKTLLDGHQDVEKHFVHIDTDGIRDRNPDIKREDVKGLDDLLITFAGREAEIVKDLYDLNRSGVYFQKFHISFQINKVYNYFHLGNVKDFYLFHVDRRPELKDKEFKFVGTIYKYNEQTNECDIIIPQESKNYFRVGDTYYKYVLIPNKYGQLERSFRIRQKGTIVDDHGKNFIRHIPKYEAFCSVPNHTNFQQIIHGNFNMYNPIEHEPENHPCGEEECPTIIKLIEHVFGTHTVETKVRSKNEAGETTLVSKKIAYRDLGLDYCQLLYQHPTQKLPVLCLVSKENETGKTTFAMLLKNIFTANVAIVGNADLADNFNGHWASKLLIVCDETKIDKQSVVEKVKSLSTADKIMMNSKGKDQVELDFYGKFMLLTNNEDNFIYASDEDLRYWVIKVPKILEKNPHLMEQMLEEIPAFLSFLNNRKMVTDYTTRMWFDPALLKTEALKRVIEHSKPTIEKELRQHIREMFMDFGMEQLLMSRKDVHKEVFNNKWEANYLQSVLTERLAVEPFHVWTLIDGGTEYATRDEAQAAISTVAVAGQILTPTKKYKTTRYSYPRWEEKFNEGKKESVRVDVVCPPGRPYVFQRKDFISDTEWAMIQPDPENRFINEMTPPVGGLPQAPHLTEPVDDLPF